MFTQRFLEGACVQMAHHGIPSRRLFAGLVPLAVVLLCAADAVHDNAENAVRAANAAFLRREADVAEKLYADAEERTADPGLVAFNKATLLAQKEDFRDAELHYRRALEDRACPPERAAKAWFNCGTCLLRRGGNASVYRSAVACFERCLELEQPEPQPAAVRDNLELAKLLWAEANRKEAKPRTPNEPVEEDLHTPPPAPPLTDPGGSNDPGGRAETIQQPKIEQVPGPAPNGALQKTDAQTAGNKSNLPLLKDDDTLQPLTAEDTREYLRRAEERLKKDRQALLGVLYGPERVGVKDW
jgi:tetratricopeptide (TPR) repeat protein